MCLFSTFVIYKKYSWTLIQGFSRLYPLLTQCSKKLFYDWLVKLYEIQGIAIKIFIINSRKVRRRFPEKQHCTVWFLRIMDKEISFWDSGFTYIGISKK